MKELTRRRISTALAALLAVTAAMTSSCGSPEAGSETTAESNVTTDAPETTDPRNISDELPEKDFEGKEFTMLTEQTAMVDVDAESLNGDVINDAIYNRNQAVADRFNAKITVTGQQYLEGELNPVIEKSVFAGDEEFQLVVHHAVHTSALVLKDLLMNWYELPYIDFSKPWWPNSTTEDLTYGDDKAIIVIGDLALSSIGGTYCYFFDKNGAADYGLENLYDVVNDGKWTLDYVMNTVKDVYKDLNGNSKQDEEDYYGLSQNLLSAVNAYYWSSGAKVITKAKDGKLEITVNTPKTYDIIEKLYKLCYNTDGVCTQRNYTGNKADHNAAGLAFRDDLSLMTAGTLDMSIQFFRDRKGEYGILPYPKFDENQENYATMADGYHSVLAIPKTISDPEFVGIITEALNAESFKTVVPQYYEVALKTKYTFDDESVQILDMIVNSRVFDFGYIYDAWKGMAFYTQYMIKDEKSTDFASYYASKSPASIEYYNDVFEFFDNLE